MPNLLAVPYTSQIPFAVDALYGSLKAAFDAQLAAGGDRVYVRDSPWTEEQSGGAYVQDLAICWYGFYPGYQYPTRSLSEELGEAMVSGHNTAMGMGPSQEETFSISCASLVASGQQAREPTWSKARKLAYANIRTAAAAVSDPVAGRYLNGTVERMTFAASTTLHQVPGRRGVLVLVTFSVECTTTSQQ